MDYIRKAMNNFLLKNNKSAPFPDNDSMMAASLCAANSLKCIMRICSVCKKFPKIDKLRINELKCSKACLHDNADCTEHTVLLHQFDRVTYMHKGKEKKKLKLLDNMIKLPDLVLLLKTKMQTFPLHQFNVTQTAKTFDQSSSTTLMKTLS